MKGTVDAKAFYQALDIVSRIPQKSKIFIAEMIHIRFSNGCCILTGTDMDAWLSAEIPAQGDNFAFVLPRIKNMVKVCRRFEGELELEVTEYGTGKSKMLKGCMRCGFRGGEFDAASSDIYPDRPELEAEHTFTANAAELLKRIERIKYAAARPSQTARQTTSCIQFDGHRVFCLDGLRAAWDDSSSLSIPEPFMASAAHLGYLKWFSDHDTTFQIGRRYVHITDGMTALQIPRAEGRVFDLDAAVPKNVSKAVFVQTKEFMGELTYLKEFIPNTQKPYVYFSNGELRMLVNNCKYRTRIYVEGEGDIQIAFNLRYMMDALRQFKDEAHVKLQVFGPISPILLTADSRSDCAMVLPVRSNFAAAA